MTKKIEVFASEALPGELEEFPDIKRGWGTTKEATGGIPPMKWFNAIQKRTDEWLLYLTQRGIPEWDSSLDYPKSSVVTHGDVIYISLRTSKGEQPNTTQAAWSTLVGFLGLDNKLDKSAVVQVTGTSTTNVISQKAVTDNISDIQKLILDAVPVGVIKAYVGGNVPNSRWLLCRGQAFSAESYPDLAQLLPDLKIPDLRGVALRGLDANRGFDAGRELLSYQEDAMQKITGSYRTLYSELSESVSGAFSAVRTGTGIPFSGDVNRYGSINLDSSRVTRTNAQDETVMKNVTVNFIIKAR